MARNGFQVTPLLETRLQTIEELCLTDPRWGEVYAPLGRLARVGETIYRTKLADVLEAIAQNGSADRTATPSWDACSHLVGCP